jgi:hypothetical protein
MAAKTFLYLYSKKDGTPYCCCPRSQTNENPRPKIEGKKKKKSSVQVCGGTCL